jgi:hypothetical protein
MRLLSINYWAGKDKKNALVLSVGQDKLGNLLCLKSEKVTGADITKIRDNLEKLNRMETGELASWLNAALNSYKNAFVTMRKGRYEIVSEYPIDG